MPLQQQQDLLARLYIDPEFQSKFLDDPKGFATDAGLSGDEVERLASTAADEVRWYADSLINKRLREVVKMLPLSHRVIGEKAFEQDFRRFAENFSANSVKKHLEDASAFSDRLMKEDLDVPTRSVVRFESRRLRHNSLGGTVSFCVLRQDPRNTRSGGIGLWIAVGRWSQIFFRAGRDG